jgi:pectate lyase
MSGRHRREARCLIKAKDRIIILMDALIMLRTALVILIMSCVVVLQGCQRGSEKDVPAGEVVKAVVATVTTPAQVGVKVPSFPGAEGFGMWTPGGRGGRVIEVTSLEDKGPGTLREALEEKGPRIVVFRVGGLITLQTPLTISEPFITIAGQTAPRDGICVQGETTNINTHDVILRYMRFRRGNLVRRDDALGGYPQKNIIIDHCSASWGLDENLSMYRWMKPMPNGKKLKSPVENMTIQWCISSEALNTYNHAFGGTWGGKNCSFHHNLFASNAGRNPSIGWCDGLDYRNNVIFNWRHRTMDGGGAGMINVVNNYYKPGPAVNPGQIRYRVCKPDGRFDSDGRPNFGRWHVTGNVMEGSDEVTADNWAGGVQAEVEPNRLDEVLVSIKMVDAFAAPRINQQMAAEAYKLVLEGAGASLPKRDAVDARVTEMVKTGRVTFGNGIIMSPTDVGGWPKYSDVGKAPVDSDHDGMPDEWEKKYGLNPTDASDGAEDKDGDGYTNVEEYINGTDPTGVVDYSKPENNVSTLKALY